SARAAPQSSQTRLLEATRGMAARTFPRAQEVVSGALSMVAGEYGDRTGRDVGRDTNRPGLTVRPGVSDMGSRLLRASRSSGERPRKLVRARAQLARHGGASAAPPKDSFGSSFEEASESA